jgi:hypothetical protein
MAAAPETASRKSIAGWPSDLALRPEVLRAAFPGAGIRQEAPDRILVLDGDQPALRFTGAAGGPAREIEAHAAAARWLPWIAPSLREAETARERLDCRAVQGTRICEHPDHPDVVFRFDGESAKTMTWTAPSAD